MPGERSSNRNSPRLSLAVLRSREDSVANRRIFADGIRAPLESVTVPLRPPRKSWAGVIEGKRTRTAMAAILRHVIVIRLSERKWEALPSRRHLSTSEEADTPPAHCGKQGQTTASALVLPMVVDQACNKR